MHYYAILPADVRYSDLTPTDKLVYAELTANSDGAGYGYTNSEFLAAALNISRSDAEISLANLQTIYIELEKDSSMLKFRIRKI